MNATERNKIFNCTTEDIQNKIENRMCGRVTYQMQ